MNASIFRKKRSFGADIVQTEKYQANVVDIL